MHRHHTVLAPVGGAQQVVGNPDRCSELAWGHGDKLVACEWRDGDLTLTLTSDLCSRLNGAPYVPPKDIFVSQNL